jgi:prevent-host-death family protein
MTTVGVRELRQRASELLRRVERGETIEITDRGRPVAVLGPIPTVSPLERLRLTGDIQPASSGLADLPDPLPSSGGRLPSEVLADLRSGER